jgi:hypothetical protein
MQDGEVNKQAALNKWFRRHLTKSSPTKPGPGTGSPS